MNPVRHLRRLASTLPVALVACLLAARTAGAAPPRPLAAHPGNVFLAGEELVIPLPASPAGRWRLLDDEDRPLAQVAPAEGKVRLDPLPVGFYRLRPEAGPDQLWVSLAVLAPLHALTPPTSPVALDVAMAWFYSRDNMDAVASLCALAGVNWVRDRLNWADVEPRRGQFAGPTRYDASAQAQSRAGLRLLQVMHRSPAWANPDSKRFPLDLRDTFRFCEHLARRWRGQMLAFEPWNEADIPQFGGHTGAEMAALQKAAWWGLKAGNPDILVCLNVFALHNRPQLEDLHENRAWPCFDTYNLHHYEPFENYPRLYADHRAVSAGRPLWVSECALPVKWAGDPKLQEPTDADLRVQAERVAKTFACSLHEGAAATFYFLLPHYVEGQTQFGLLRPDLTPRPAYVALAAVGRLLADARPLGRVRHPDSRVRAFLFRAQPDGRPREVLVAWSTNGSSALALPAEPQALCDHLGRPWPKRLQEVPLSAAPCFALLPVGTGGRLALEPPPQPAPFEQGRPCPVVLQALWPKDKTDLKQSAYRLTAGKAETIPVNLYNFSSSPARGTLRVEAPPGWTVQLPAKVELAPQERRELQLLVEARPAAGQPVGKVRVSGEFGAAGPSVLALRLLAGAASSEAR